MARLDECWRCGATSRLHNDPLIDGGPPSLCAMCAIDREDTRIAYLSGTALRIIQPVDD